MKFTKTALTLALVAASGSAMAEALKVGEGIIDGFNNVFAGSGYTLEKGGAGNVNLIKPDDTAVRLATLDKDTGYYSVDYDTVSQLKADGTAKMDTFLREHFGDDVIVTPVVPAPIGGVPVSREEAVQYVQDNGLLNLDGLEQAVKYRKNNENKYNLSENLTGEQKTSAINAVAEDEYLLVYNHAGEKALYNNTTGEYVTEADIADAKAAIVEEAQKRSDEKKLPIVGPKDPVVDPGKGVGAPQAKEAVINALTDHADELRSTYTGAEAQDAMEELYAQGRQNASDIDTLFGEVDRLDERIDGVMASAQAVTAARPYLSTNQTNSVGVGVGYAGDVAAVAVGYAHRINPNWTANANVSATTGSDVDVSAGAGISYAW